MERDLLKDKAEQVQRERRRMQVLVEEIGHLYLEKVSVAVALAGSVSELSAGEVLQTHHTRGAATDQEKV